MEAERVISSYEELVHDPMRATFRSVGQPFFTTSSLNFEIGVARSGVKGPLMCGSNSDRFYDEKSLVSGERPSCLTHDINNLVVFGVLVRTQVVRKPLCIFGNFRTFGGIQVVPHAFVERENGSRSTNFRTHVANSRHPSCGEAFHAQTLVLNNGTSTTFHRKYARNLEDDVCGE